jgi:DNA replication protein DnaC
MQCFKNAQGEWQEILAYGTCAAHGKYPASFRRWLGTDKFGASMSVAGCPECVRKANELKAYGQAAIPERFQGKTIEGYIAETPAQKAVKDFFSDYIADLDENIRIGRSIILCGNPGTGKTHLACALVAEAQRNGYSALFTSVAKAVRSIRETWGAPGKTERQAIEAYASVDLLVVDEIGVQSGTANEQNLLFAVLNDRYESMRPTVLISNLDLAGIEKAIGARAFDRLRENGGRGFIFDWDSYRTRVRSAPIKPVNLMPQVFEFTHDDKLPEEK